MWYTFFGAMVAIIVASICTCIFGGNDPADVDPSLLTPLIRNRFHKKVGNCLGQHLAVKFNLKIFQDIKTIPIEKAGVIESSF